MCRIAVISVHSCPLARLGSKDTGGMSVYIKELSRELGTRGMTVDVFTRVDDPSKRRVVEFAANARVIHVPAGELAHIDKTEIWPHLPEFVWNIHQFKEEHGLEYQFIHSHYWLSGWAGALLSQRWQVPHATMFHTLGAIKNLARPEEHESALRIEVERRVMASADAIVAATEHERAEMVRLYGARPRRIHVIPCGVNLDLFRPLPRETAREAVGLNGKKALLFVGRVEPLKGIDLLLKTFAQVANERDDCELLVAGGDPIPGSYTTQMRQMAVRLGVPERVRFLGTVEQQRLPLYYSAVDICVVPSHYESFGLSAAEALACGTPVVASKVGGLPTIVREGENGFLIPWRCPEAFAERINLLLSDSALWSRLSANARTSVEHLDWGTVAENVLDVYRQLRLAMRPGVACLCGSTR